MIIKAKHHFVIYPFFKLFSRVTINRHFSRIEIIGDVDVSSNRSILLLSNHSSWWDGFWHLYLNMKVFKKKFHFMMLEEQLKKHWYFNYTGGFSVKKSTRSAVETIQYSAELLSHPNNLVLMFPQGKVESIHKHSVTFEKGVEKILERTNRADVQIVFLVNTIDFFINRKPILYHYIKEYNAESINYLEIEQHYNAFFMESIKQQTDKRM
ncbi:MAG TPA: lysophospholipid acyltransferase family protein [Dysgonamonadaceae bacterium]|nr:lysophospholipid acyltransferase family protein [Dysgonamonadaceae bacterium]